MDKGESTVGSRIKGGGDQAIRRYNPGEGIWGRIGGSRNIGQGKKSLISIFAQFLIAIAKVQFLEGRLGTRPCLHLNSRFF